MTERRIFDMADEAIVKYPCAEQWVFEKDELLHFVKLIIRDCIAVANTNRTAMELDRNAHLAADAIKEHFGVE